MFRITFTSLLFVAAIALFGVESTHAATQADLDAYDAAVDVYNARVHRYERAAAEFNSERESYEHAVSYYNSLPEDQRTQFQYDRLERWYNYLEQRLRELNAEWDYLNRRGVELGAWAARLEG